MRMYNKFSRVPGWFMALTVLPLFAVVCASSGLAGYIAEPAAVLHLALQSNATTHAALPVIPFDGTLAGVLGAQLMGDDNENSADRLMVWDAVQQAYLIAFKAQNGTWLESGSSATPATFELSLGRGFLIENRHEAQTLLIPGRVAMETNTTHSLAPGCNLFGLSSIVALSLQDSALAASGAAGGDSPTSADLLVDANGVTNWLFSSSGHPLNGSWLTSEGTLSSFILSLGEGLWYYARAAETFTWRENNEIAELPVSSNQPAILDISISDHTATLTIDATDYDPIEIFRRETPPGASPEPFEGWT
ncbi:MAG: hypothetical protein EOM20_09655, partial [Spartobacteria bacterium]|nr:hypothetical protein [Spartobacteria bacterium]